MLTPPPLMMNTVGCFCLPVVYAVQVDCARMCAWYGCAGGCVVQPQIFSLRYYKLWICFRMWKAVCPLYKMLKYNANFLSRSISLCISLRRKGTGGRFTTRTTYTPHIPATTAILLHRKFLADEWFRFISVRSNIVISILKLKFFSGNEEKRFPFLHLPCSSEAYTRSLFYAKMPAYRTHIVVVLSPMLFTVRVNLKSTHCWKNPPHFDLHIILGIDAILISNNIGCISTAINESLCDLKKHTIN